MGEMRRLSVDVDEAAAAEVRNAIAAGDYVDEDAVLNEALSLWRSNRRADVARLRKAWQEGLASGEPIEGNFDVEDIKRRGLERLKTFRA